MGNIYLEGKGIIKHNGKPVTVISIAEDEEIILEFIPFNDKRRAIPYAVSVKLSENELISESELVTIIKWGSDYELRFSPLIYEKYSPPEAINQNVAYTPNGEITVTVYKDSRTRICAEGPGLYFIHTPEFELIEPDIKLSQSNDKILALILGKSGEQLYLNIMLIKDKARILYEDYGENISYNQNSIKITKRIKDMKGRLIHSTLTYNGAKYQEISRIIEYTYEHKFISELLPYAFMEAVMAKDIEDAKNYLDKGLDANALIEFFGDIQEISPVKYNEFDGNCLAIIKREREQLISVVYRFELIGDIITNIIEEDL